MSADPWSSAFLVLFLIGLLSIVGMLAMGALHGQGDAGHAAHGHGDGGDGGHGGHGHAHGHGLVHGLLAPLMNFTSLLALLMCGGAAGFIAQRIGGLWPASMGAAAAAGYGGAWLMVGTLRLLWRMEAGVVRGGDPRGTLARVIATVGRDRMGEIVFTRDDGSRQAMPARAEEGEELERDAQVVVMRVEQGTAYVKRLRQLAKEKAS